MKALQIGNLCVILLIVTSDAAVEGVVNIYVTGPTNIISCNEPAAAVALKEPPSRAHASTTETLNITTIATTTPSTTIVTAAAAGVIGQEVEDDVLPQLARVPNITVTVGRNALLTCTVENLSNFKVAWIMLDTQNILTIHKQVIIRNPRISVLHDDHKSWHLQIRNVQESDRGWYMCQINTDPMMSRQGFLDVVAPPDIIDEMTSGDQTVREGEDVTLYCRARGHPTPTIVWRREDNGDIYLENGNSRSGAGAIIGNGSTRQVEGDTLVLRKVNRLQMGTYLCMASNGVPPSMSKRIDLKVTFPPVVWVSQQLVGADIGQEVIIECEPKAYPKSINFWTNPNGEMIISDNHYTQTLKEEMTYKTKMTLRIHQMQKEDFGIYRCNARNNRGGMDGSIKIYKIST